MESLEQTGPERSRVCVMCGKEAVAVDRNDDAMCAKHASIFFTKEYRDNVTDRARIVR